MDKVVHFEVPADDIARAKEFYKKVFGWDTMSYGDSDVELVTTGPTDEKGPKEPGYINGDIFKRNELGAKPMIVLDVTDIEAKWKEIEEAGGKKVGEKKEIPGQGWYAYFIDSEGNYLGLWQTT